MSVERVPCDFCQQPLDPRATTTYPLVRAYSNLNRTRGANEIFLVQPPEGYCCQMCRERKKLGIPTGQTGLAL